jgi:hypothetical protein
MRRRTTAVAAASVVLALVVGTAESAAGRSPAPHLKLVTTVPLVVRGSAFHAHESVRLVLRQRTGAPTISHAGASSAGNFRATFASARINRCGGFSIVATGSEGSRATLRRPLPLPACSRGRAARRAA